MYCLKCFREYPTDTDYCDPCNFLIQGEGKFGAHFMQLVRVGEEIMNDEIKPPVLSAVLENMGKVLFVVEKRLELETDSAGLAESPDEVKKVVEQPMSYALEGISCYREGLKTMGRYLDKQDNAYIKEGLALAERANDLLNLSREMSEHAARELEKIGEGSAGAMN
ncbi:MAG: hypothetical protein HYU64_09160 [Armatimonadetes bacterium]|nr:hypothetical protein [Armatimonadota bacterium]